MIITAGKNQEKPRKVRNSPGAFKSLLYVEIYAMNITEFMIALAKQLQEDRKIAESTATQYLQTLYKLNGSKSFTNLAWTKKYETVQAIIDSYADSTKGNQYMVLSSALSTTNAKTGYKAVIEHWKGKMLDARKDRDALPIHEKSEKQEKNWLSWAEINQKKTQLQKEILPLSSAKRITQSQFDILQQYLVLSLFTDIPPRRNQDYLEMYVIKKLPKMYDTDKNYYDMATHRFIFNKYKTAKTYKEQVENVPVELQQSISLYLKFHPLNKGKINEFKLLVKYDGSPLNTVNSITRILNKVFDGKKVGTSMLRHIFLSEKYGKEMKELDETRKTDAEAMGHSVSQATEYIKY